MQEDAAVFRTTEALASGVKRLEAVHAKRPDLKVTDRGLIWNTDLLETLELDNLIGQATVTVVGAHNRTESRGAHALDDHPTRDDENWLKHTLWYSEGSRLDYKPVQMKPLTVESFPPKARTF
ncbi:Succinate dehydrogenase flavoprotein subunit [bioreactor metagenome]|uniref:Succinate dehydrogenase flavoprotein subunit n=1 Tax=bioreactor metagenome TaxID=1076179 RepID=A0A645JKG3_9ZZZZ